MRRRSRRTSRANCSAPKASRTQERGHPEKPTANEDPVLCPQEAGPSEPDPRTPPGKKASLDVRKPPSPSGGQVVAPTLPKSFHLLQPNLRPGIGKLPPTYQIPACSCPISRGSRARTAFTFPSERKHVQRGRTEILLNSILNVSTRSFIRTQPRPLLYTRSTTAAAAPSPRSPPPPPSPSPARPPLTRTCPAAGRGPRRGR